MEQKQCVKLADEIKALNPKRLSVQGAAQKLAYLNYLEKAAKDKQDELKKYLKDNNFAGCEYVPDIEKKVYIGSSTSSSFDVDKIGQAFQKARKLSEFFSIVNIVQKRIDELEKPLPDSLVQIIESNKQSETKPSLKIGKMTKDEIVDYK